MGLRKTLRSILAVGMINYVKAKSKAHGDLIRVQINGRHLSIRARTTDLSVAIDSLSGEYDPLERLLPKSFDGLIVDAGAYIGTASIRLAEMYPHSTLVAIEPSSFNFAVLSENTRNYSSIRLEKAALSDVAGMSVELRDTSSREWGFTIVSDGPSENARSLSIETVTTISLAEIEKKYSKKIGLLKLDIEGQEKRLFENADAVLAAVPVVFVELHERNVPGCEEAFRSFSQRREVRKHKGEKLLSLLKV